MRQRRDWVGLFSSRTFWISDSDPSSRIRPSPVVTDLYGALNITFTVLSISVLPSKNLRGADMRGVGEVAAAGREASAATAVNAPRRRAPGVRWLSCIAA